MVLELSSDPIVALVAVGMAEVDVPVGPRDTPDHADCNWTGAPILYPEEQVRLIRSYRLHQVTYPTPSSHCRPR
jgi:hypothetical protein